MSGPTTGRTSPGWVADPGISWRIVLTARLESPLAPDDLARRLQRLGREQGWPPPDLEMAADLDRLRRELAARPAERGVVSVGLAADRRGLCVAAHHSRVDGLGLLRILGALVDRPLHSEARGVGARPDAAGTAGTVVRRLGEVVLAPPATIDTDPPAAGGPVESGDVFVERELPGRVGAAELVRAAALGVAAHQRSRGLRAPRHVAIAVGLARRDDSPARTTGRIADRSALLRLRDVERLDLASIRTLLRTAPTQRAVSGGSPVGGALLGWGLRTLAPRLGSTLLVSHLGRVRGEGVSSLAFHPVTAGGTGVSLGAVTLDERTRLTLRARGSAWTHDGLERVLEAVVDQLT